MTIKELLEHLNLGELTYMENYITGDLLESVKDLLLQCDEFKHVTELKVIKDNRYSYKGRTKSVSTRKFSSDERISGVVYLKSITLGPEMFDPHKYYNTAVKDGCALTPTVYNPETFEPSKMILMTTPISGVDEGAQRDLLHKQLDDILDNPSDYAVKGEKALLMAGIFGEIYSPHQDVSHAMDMSQVSFDVNEFNAFYRSSLPDGSNVVETIWLPTSLEEAYARHIATNGIPTYEVLKSFILANS